MTDPYGLLVIGNGPAGTSAAAAYVRAGGAGRVCVLTADVDEHYQRPPLSKAVLAGDEPPERTPALDDEPALEGVEVRLRARVAHLDLAATTVRLEDGEEIGYERLVVATGSTPVRLPDVAEDAKVHVLRSLADARGLVAAVDDARSAVVVGSGFIGCEAAASLATRGLDTVLVTPEEQPQAARLGPWAGDRLSEWLRAAGVRLHSGSGVATIAAPAVVRLEDGSSYDADVVLVAVGVEQTQPFLEKSGLATEDGRLVVGSDLRTSDPHVWAAGDVAMAHHDVVDRPLSVEHWGDALTMGELAGGNAAGGQEVWSDAPGFWSEIGEHTLKYSAWGDGFETAEVVEGDGGAFTVWYADAEGELVGVLTHEHDDDYERGADLLGRRARLEEVLGP